MLASTTSFEPVTSAITWPAPADVVVETGTPADRDRDPARVDHDRGTRLVDDHRSARCRCPRRRRCRSPSRSRPAAPSGLGIGNVKLGPVAVPITIPFWVSVQATVSVASGSGSVTSAVRVIVPDADDPRSSLIWTDGRHVVHDDRRVGRGGAHAVRHRDVDVVAAPGRLAGRIIQVLVRGRVGVKPRRGRRDDLAERAR